MYITEKIDDNSYNDIEFLFHESLNTDVTSETLAKKFDTESFGLKNIGIIAKDPNGETAAYYGVFPITMTYDSKDILAAQSGDTITGPKHRKKGLFTRLAKETYQLSEESGIQLIFGFPNQNSYPGFIRKLNWVFNGAMQRFFFQVKAIPLSEIATKFSFLSSFYFKLYKSRIAKHNIDISKEDFSCFNHSNVKGLIKKDSNFFEYKLRNEDISLINFNTYKLLIKVKTFLFIGDVGYKKDFDIDSFMNAIESLAKKVGCRQVYFSLSKNHWLFEHLSKKGSPDESLPIGFFIIDKEINIEEIQFVYGDLDTF